MTETEKKDPCWRRHLDATLANTGDDPSARFAQLATVDTDGRPANRTVVIRLIQAETNALIIATDVRSDKVVQLQAAPEAELCWYLAAPREQFRIRGTVTVVDRAAQDADQQALRRHIWQTLGTGTQRTFYGQPPGSHRDATRAAAEPVPAQVNDGPAESMAILILEPYAVDHLDLKTTPHRRTLHRRMPDGGWISTIVNP